MADCRLLGCSGRQGWVAGLVESRFRMRWSYCKLALPSVLSAPMQRGWIGRLALAFRISWMGFARLGIVAIATGDVDFLLAASAGIVFTTAIYLITGGLDDG